MDVDGAGAGDDDVVVDVDAGASTVTITATFDEPMSDTIPTVTLSPEVASTLSETSVEWMEDATTLVASYSVSDANIDEDAVSADITGAYDVAGNEIVDYVASVELSIDTQNPTVTGITSSFADAESDGVVSDSDPVVSYTATFSEAVQGVGGANIAVTNGTLVAGSVVLAEDGLSVTFDAQADDASTAAMTVQVLDTVVDVYGNALDESTSSSSPQSVDTVNPEAPVITVVDGNVTVSDASGGAFTVTGEDGASIDIRLTGSNYTAAVAARDAAQEAYDAADMAAMNAEGDDQAAADAAQAAGEAEADAVAAEAAQKVIDDAIAAAEAAEEVAANAVAADEAAAAQAAADIAEANAVRAETAAAETDAAALAVAAEQAESEAADLLDAAGIAAEACSRGTGYCG